MEAPLLRWIAERIAAGGPVTFATFMGWALYHPDFGYYASGRVRVGHDEGDFTTAPHLTVLFARCLANLVQAADRALGEPPAFVLAEGGPGEGRLARDLLDHLRATAPGLYARLRYAPDEVSPALRKRQEKLWEPHRGLLSPWPPRTPAVGLYLSNELLDAFPVHRLVRRDGRLWEIFVARDGRGLTEVLRPPSTPELAAELAGDGVELAEGCEAEVNLGLRPWLERTSQGLDRGYLVTVDYGDEARRLYGPHRAGGTVVAYRGHRASAEVLADPGRQDLTAHVNFSALRRHGAALGLQDRPPLALRDFLFALGLLREMEGLGREGSDPVASLEARRAVAPLLFPGAGMGESFRVLVQARGAPLDALPLDPSRGLATLADC